MSRCKYYDAENGLCKKFTYWDEPMANVVFCDKGLCDHEEKMTNYDLIKSLSLHDMAVFLASLLSEEDRKIQQHLAEQGCNVSLIEMTPVMQIKIHEEYLEREVE